MQPSDADMVSRAQERGTKEGACVAGGEAGESLWGQLVLCWFTVNSKAQFSSWPGLHRSRENCSVAQ